jgi:hypothetical protein
VFAHPDTDGDDNVAHSGIFTGAVLPVATDDSVEQSRHT